MNFVEEFLKDIDRAWRPPPEVKIKLKVLGSTALFLRAGYVRGTKDSDVLETDELAGALKTRLLEVAGPSSPLHKKHRIYIDVVSKQVPLLPWEPLWHPHPLELGSFEVFALDAADVVVSKLKRFNSNDRDDVRAMLEGGHVEQERVVERLNDVIDKYQWDGRSDLLPEMVSRFNEAEANWLGVEPTSIHLPDHVDR